MAAIPRTWPATPEHHGALVDRPQLYRQLDRWQQLRAVVIHAPTGYGKTSLVRRWLDLGQPPPPTAWLTLDERDGDPRRFAQRLVMALDKLAPGVLVQAQAVLQDPQGSIVRALKGAFAHLDDVAGAAGLAAGVGHFLVVVDDLHRIESPEIDAALQWVLEDGPPQVHLFLLSRQRPTLPLARLYAHGRIAVLDKVDLQFTAQEIEALLAQEGFQRPTEAELAQLAARSEGWAAALRLAVLAAHRRRDVGNLVRLLDSGTTWLADYLAEEVLRQQPPEIRAFLLHTSLLDRFNAPLCAAITGDGAARAHLDTVARADLFLVPVDDHPGWYRYHALFQDWLRRQLPAQAAPAEIAALNRRAADWLVAAGDLPAAAPHFLAAGEDARAAALIESQMPVALLHDPDRARALLALLPADLVARRPQLVLDRCRLAILRDSTDAAALAEAAARTLEATAASDPDAERHHAEWLVLRATGAFIRGDLPGAANGAQLAAPCRAHLDDLHRAIYEFLRMHLAGHARDWAEVERCGAVALGDFERAGFEAGTVALRRELAKWSMLRGDAAQASTRFRELAHRWRLNYATVARELVHAYLSAAENSYWQDRLDEARVYQRRATALAIELQDSDIMAVARCLARLLDPDAGAAQTDVAAAARHCSQVAPPGAAQMLLDCQCRVFIAAGRGDLAWSMVQLSALHDGTAPEDLELRPLITYLRAYIARGIELEAVTPLLDAGLAAAHRGDERFWSLHLLALSAWQQRRLGRLTGAEDTLRAAAGLAHKTGYVRMLLDIPELAWSANEPGTAGTDSGRPLLTAREVAVLAGLAADLTYAEIAAEMVISIGTVRTHVRHIYKKLAVHGRDQGIRRARELGLLEEGAEQLHSAVARP